MTEYFPGGTIPIESDALGLDLSPIPHTPEVDINFDAGESTGPETFRSESYFDVDAALFDNLIFKNPSPTTPAATVAAAAKTTPTTSNYASLLAPRMAAIAPALDNLHKAQGTLNLKEYGAGVEGVYGTLSTEISAAKSDLATAILEDSPGLTDSELAQRVNDAMQAGLGDAISARDSLGEELKNIRENVSGEQSHLRDNANLYLGAASILFMWWQSQQQQKYAEKSYERSLEAQDEFNKQAHQFTLAQIAAQTEGQIAQIGAAADEKRANAGPALTRGAAPQFR